jgi:type IX secretion system PorP/SprF family membrane protein
MNRRLLILFFSGLFAGSITAQQDPVYSQYMFNQMAINPAYAGINDMVCVGLDLRNQWIGIEGAPNTRAGNVNAAVKPFGISAGVGFGFMQETFGFNKNYSAYIPLSYKINIRNGKLGIGLNIGFANSSIVDGSKWITPQSEIDNAIPKGTAFGFDMGLGTYYKTDNLYMGFSVNHLVATKLDYKDAGSFKPVPNYNILAGYKVQLANPEFEIEPSTYISSDGKSSQVTLNSNLVYNKKIWGGVSYRVGNAFTALFGLEIFNGVQVCFSNDFTTNDLQQSQKATTEITVRYCFNLKVDKIPQRYKSVRFL